MGHLERLTLLSVNATKSFLSLSADRKCVVNILDRALGTTRSWGCTWCSYLQRSYHADILAVNPLNLSERLTEKFLPAPIDSILNASNIQTRNDIAGCFRVYENFITDIEEKSLLDEVEPYLKRLKYEADHWDDAIHGYRETERKQWTNKNKLILERVRQVAFSPGIPQLAHVHVLDIMATGVIRPHIDSVRFCGNTIAGLSLLSTAVMRLTHHEDKSNFADILLKRRSLYVMQGVSRYDYAHEVLGHEHSKFKGQTVPRERRISVICRNEPCVQNSHS